MESVVDDVGSVVDDVGSVVDVVESVVDDVSLFQEQIGSKRVHMQGGRKISKVIPFLLKSI